MQPSAETVMDRYVMPEPNTGCWLWTGATMKSGYGNFMGTTAHKWMYERMVADVPDDYHVHHRCNVKGCVYPRHLEPMPAREHLGHRQRERATCLRGHDLSGENLHVTPQGWRQCRTCQKSRTQNWRLRNPERAKELQREWGLKNPGRKAELHRLWVQRNPERASELFLLWKKEHPERMRELWRAYRMRQKEKLNA